MTAGIKYGDTDLLALFLERDRWERYRNYVKEGAVMPEAWDILGAIDEWYTNPANTAKTELDVAHMRTMFMLRKSASTKPAKMDVYTALLDALTAVKTSGKAINTDVLTYFVDMDYASMVAEIGEKFLAGRQPPGATLDESIRTVLSDYETESMLLGTTASKTAGLDALMVTDNLDDIVNKVHRGTGGVEWRLEELNLAVGPLFPGDLIVVGARPNVGKTRFMVSELTFWMEQLDPDDIAIVFNNEEDGTGIKGAVVCATLNKDIVEVSKDTAKASADFDAALGWGRIKIIDRAYMTTGFCDKVIRTYKPKIVVFNQLYKVAAHTSRRETNDAENMRRIYQWAREIAKDHGCIVVSAHQADVRGEGQKVLTQDMLYGTKTGVQGEVDLCLMIGKTHDPAEASLRTINIARNKLPGGPRTKPGLRESHFEVTFDGARSRYLSRLTYR